ncbi:MAG TPA: SH3 domain-containing protein, partial [Thermoanaerobaculia bacterium]|nr:SH3 domain-containing protein [Thermoanaerobaculia bacterium]
AAFAKVAASVVSAARREASGSDVFVTPREALLREKPSPDGRILSKLPAGTRLTLVESGDTYLKVEAVGLPRGYLSREVAVVFPAGAEATCDLVAVGKAFSHNEANRRLAAMLLLRASERLRAAGRPDARVEVLLGETVEALVATGPPFPAGLEIVQKESPNGPRAVYSGAAFRRAAEELAQAAPDKPEAGGSCVDSMSLSSTRERASLGVLSSQFPEPSSTLHALWQESAGWLQLAESAEDSVVLRAASDRLGIASLCLARYLLATGKSDEIVKLEERVRGVAAHIAKSLPEGADARKLLSRASILRAMRGDGTACFPQEARIQLGPKERVARIDGKLSALILTVETRVGATHDVQPRSRAIPILPVPGSLKISPDGKSAVWIEVSGPTSLVPVIAPLEKDEPSREIAFLASGRPLRDRALGHIVSSISGFSLDGQRLGLAIDAWNETPGPSPRYSVVSVATGELLFETSKDMRAYKRLLQ